MPSALISANSACASWQARQNARWRSSASLSLSVSAPRCANAASSLNFWCSSSRSCLFIVCFPEPLYRRALAQPFQAAIEMVPHIAERLAQPFADFSQFETLKIEQLQRSALHLRETLKGG